MIKAILKRVLPLTAVMLSLTACGGYVSYYDRLETSIEMSEEMQKLYSDNIITTGDEISGENVSDYCSEEDVLYTYLNSEDEYGKYRIVMVDDDKVLVITGTMFSSAEGYFVNLGTDTINTEYEVPQQLGFEDNIVELAATEQYSNVYSFHAGI